MNNSVVGLDIAKNVFHFYSMGVDTKAIKKKLKRNELLAFFANYPTSLIGIEACGGAHYWQIRCIVPAKRLMCAKFG
ncbi:MAG: hypothetical protein H6940_11630 [Burkholderiales bacterium]|nr:hypothetical protein [Burkholderiales bacterium]